MAASRGSTHKWLFTREQLENSPSRRCGVEPDRELSYRQQAANLIQDMGQRLNVSQLTMNTAIVYMHRFYMLHSFTRFHRNVIAPTTLFLASKIEEQPRKLEHVIKVSHACLNPQEPALDTKSNAYLQQAQELVILESIVLQTLGFELTIDHPHTDVVKCTQLVRASKDLSQTSYFMATNSLHLTTFCLQYRPTVIACVCIHLACKWSNWEIPVSTDSKHWWEYVDPSVTLQLLDELTHEFLQILEKTPSKLKRIRNWRATQVAKKPKLDSQPLDGSAAIAGPSWTHDGDAVPSEAPADLSYTTLTAPNECGPEPAHSDTYALKPIPSHAAQHLRPPKNSNEHAKANSSGSSSTRHSSGSATCPPPPPPPPAPAPAPATVAPAAPTQKLSLEKYKEKHAADLAAQRHRLDQQRHDVATGIAEQPQHQHQHRKHGQSGSSSSDASTPKIKAPPPVPDKREKASSLTVRIPASSVTVATPTSTEKLGSGREELKMKIKVSSERHSSSDEGNSKSKHSGKDKHRDRDQQPHRHHHHRQHHHRKHAQTHQHPHPSNGRAIPEEPAPGAALKSPPGDGSGSSRKRQHANAEHNHHSKKSKSSKGVAGSSTLSSSLQQSVTSSASVLNPPFPPPPPPPLLHPPLPPPPLAPVVPQVGFQHLSTNLSKEDKKAGPEVLVAKGLNSFDILNSLLSAQGMKL